MANTNFIAALTPSTGYKSYPPFINFSMVDDKVHIRVRGHEKINAAGHLDSGDQIVIEVLPDDFMKLISETALTIIRNMSVVGEEG